MLIFVVFFYVYHMHNIKLVFAIWEDAGRFAMIITTLLREAWQCVLDFNNIETVWLGQGGRQDYLYTLGWLWEISRRVAGEVNISPDSLEDIQSSSFHVGCLLLKMDFDKIPNSSGWNVALNQTVSPCHRPSVLLSCLLQALFTLCLPLLSLWLCVCVHGWDSSRVPTSGWTHLQQSITCSRWAHQEASGWALFFARLFNYAVSKASAL